MTTHILAMGGGGFSMSKTGAATPLDRYLLDLCPKRSPLVCFVPTASADSPAYINQFLNAYGVLGVRTMVLTLWQDAGRSIERLNDADVVIVGGGSTVNLMALWNIHGVSTLLRSMAKNPDRDIVLGGISAGASCWFQGCTTDTYGDVRPWRGGCSIIEGSFSPHFSYEADRAPVFTQSIASGALPGGYGVDDGVGLHFVDGELTEVVAEEPGRQALRIDPSNEPTTSGVVTEVLTPHLI